MPNAMTSQDFPNLFISVGQSLGVSSSNNITKLADLEDIQLILPVTDGQILKYIDATKKWTNVDPQLISSTEIAGIALRSGDGVNTTFLVPHGFGKVPTTTFVEGNSADAEDDFDYSVDDTNITITYYFPPPAGTNNLSFYYRVS